MATLEKLRCDGNDAKLAGETLRAFEASPQVMREYRDLIMAFNTTSLAVDVGAAVA